MTLINTAQTAELIGIPVYSLRNRRYALKGFPKPKSLANKHFYDLEAVQEWMKDNKASDFLQPNRPNAKPRPPMTPPEPSSFDVTRAMEFLKQPRIKYEDVYETR